METKNIIKIVLSAILLIGLIWIVLANGIFKTKTSDVKDVIVELIDLKDIKQECLDNLSYQEAIEEYKGLSHCGNNDERIKELKETLQEFLRNDYERVDERIEEKRQEKILADTGTTSLEKLTFILSE